MPIYEYVCEDCEKIIELLQKVGASAPAECESCGKPDTMKKKVSQTSFQLKGGGWYSDLYSSTPKSGDAKTETSPKSESKPKDPKKPESKPDKKTNIVKKAD
jgi:putative FmdB family regulatory protein